MEQKIKKCWQQTTFSDTSASQTINPKSETALKSLAKRYLQFSRLALFLAITFPFYLTNLYHNQGNTSSTSIATIIFGSAYLLVCSIMDRWLYNGISAIDLATLTVAQACQKALYYRKKHLQFIVILLPCAAIFITIFTLSLPYNTYIIYGVICGSIVGLCIGIHKLLQFLNDYHSLTTPQILEED